MITEDREAKQRIRHPIEIDNFADTYKTADGAYTFTSPTLWIIEKNLYHLLKNSTQKQFNPKYVMRPDYLSYDEYGTVVLNQLLMYVNGVYCIEEFDLQTVIIPDFQVIIEMTQEKFTTKDVDEMIEVDW